MSNTEKCPRCENQVQSSWKYCRFCGLEIKNKSEEVNSEATEEITQEEVEEEIEVKQFDSFDKDLYYKVLSTRAERAVILKKKSEIRGEINSLLEQLQAGLIGKDAVLPKVKELKEDVKKINERNKSYSDIPEELPIEVLNDEIQAAKRRMKKIEKLKSDENVAKDTIREAKQRAEASINLLRDQQSQVFGHLRSWKADLEKNIKEIRKDVEHLYVRYKTEEITEESYKTKKEEMVSSIENDKEVVDILSQILNS